MRRSTGAAANNGFHSVACWPMGLLKIQASFPGTHRQANPYGNGGRCRRFFNLST